MDWHALLAVCCVLVGLIGRRDLKKTREGQSTRQRRRFLLAVRPQVCIYFLFIYLFIRANHFLFYFLEFSFTSDRAITV